MRTHFIGYPPVYFLLLNIDYGTNMTGNGSTDQDIILIREDLHHLQTLHLHPIAAHPAGHPYPLHDPGCIGRVTQRTRSTRTVMLTMRLSADAMKAMTLYDTLKTFTFRSTNDFYLVTFGKNIHGNRLT